jgi:hypothetical protein
MPSTLNRFKKKLYTRRDSTKTFDHGCREDSTNAFSSFSHRGTPCTRLCKCTRSPCSLHYKQFSFTLFCSVIHDSFLVFWSIVTRYIVCQRQMTNHQTHATLFIQLSLVLSCETFCSLNE